MITDITTDEGYKAMAEEVDSIFCEAVFNSRDFLIKGYWEVGNRIREFKKGEVTELLQNLALDINKSERTLWYAVSLYDKFPEYKKIEQLEEGKNLSMNKLITKYLGGEQKEKKDQEFRCPQCNYRGKKDVFKIKL